MIIVLLLSVKRLMRFHTSIVICTIVHICTMFHYSFLVAVSAVYNEALVLNALKYFDG